MCRGMQSRYVEGVHRGGTWRGMKRVHRGRMRRGIPGGVHGGGMWRGYVEGYAEGVHRGGMWRGMQRGMRRGYTVLPLAIIDLMGDNRELGSFRDILRFYTHYVWLIFSEH